MQKKKSTFFPSDWSREQVQQSIKDAYKYARKHKISPKWQSDTKNFSLVGLTNDNIKITMIINPQGQVISAYPKW